MVRALYGGKDIADFCFACGTWALIVTPAIVPHPRPNCLFFPFPPFVNDPPPPALFCFVLFVQIGQNLCRHENHKIRDKKCKYEWFVCLSVFIACSHFFLFFLFVCLTCSPSSPRTHTRNKPEIEHTRDKTNRSLVCVRLRFLFFCFDY